MSSEYSNLAFLQKYMIRKIVEYFVQNTDNITSRYVLYFDSIDNIMLFEKELKHVVTKSVEVDDLRNRIGNPNMELELKEPYAFYNDEGGLEYEATQLEIRNLGTGVTLVFVPDCDQNKEVLGDAFKNGIRNKFVDEQEDKILFYLSLQNIASVLKTTENFQKQGMPLSVECVYEDLKSGIFNIDGENERKTVLYVLNKMKANKPVSDHSLMEFAPVIRIIEAQKLEKDDFHDINMFQMSLADIGNRDVKLAENYKLHRDIALALEAQELDIVLSAYDKSIITKLQKAYENDALSWDKQIDFDTIVKNKLTNQKKFKIEQPILVLDADDSELDHRYYLDFRKGSTAAFVIAAKNYPGEKVFKIDVKFTQKAKAKSDEFVVEQQNSRGTHFRILVNNYKYYKTGKIVFTGGKENKSFTILAAVIEAEEGFFTDSCIGVSYSRGALLYKLRATDYMVSFGNHGEQAEMEVEVRKNPAPIPINTVNYTKIKFVYPEEEVLEDKKFVLNLDDNSALLNVSVKFEESILKSLELYDLFNRCYVHHNTFILNDGKLENKHKRTEKYSTEDFDAAGKKYFLEELFALEYKMIKEKYKFVSADGLKQVKEIECKVPSEVEAAYHQICDYFEHIGTIPSISTLNKELAEIYKKYIDTVLKYVHKSSDHFQDKKPVSTEILNLFYLGSVYDTDGFIWLSPLSPLSIAYQYELYSKEYQWVELDKYLYTSLGFGNIMPFMINKEGNMMQSVKGDYPVQWACYCDAMQSVKGEVDTYYRKIEDYYSKFNYLFDGIPNTAFKINIIGITHTSEVIQAIFKLFKSGNVNINHFSLEIHYYFYGIGKNDFDSMINYEYVYQQAVKYFGIKHADTVEKFCDWYSEKVKYYAHLDEGHYTYAHITFCAIQDHKQSSHLNTISEAKCGVMLKGLISDVPSSLDKNSGIYKYGFGAQYAEGLTNESQFLQLASAYNELANCKPGSSATRNLSIAQGVQNTRSDKLNEIYLCSNWVVFVEPKIDLDFFIEQSDTGRDLIIIHYPDKNVTSSGYTSITVTQKSDQYIEVIKEYLEPVVSIEPDKMDIKRIIKNFNAYSGEWLMNFINGKQIDEKLSLVSAISFCRKYFTMVYPEYVWVPIALDEVLRVTGAVGGTLTNVLYSKKVLVSRGIIESQDATSDDLLLTGIKIIDDEVYVTYIPVEVKHGKCSSDVRKEAHNQVCNTAYLLRKSFLNPEDLKGTDTEAVDRKIYRNYMVQHVISNVEKMLAYKIVEADCDYRNIIDSEVRVKLLNDLYTLELDAETDAYTFYFVEGQRAVVKSQNSLDNVIEISAPLTMMYDFLVDDEKVYQEAEALSESKLQLDQTVYDISVPSEEDEIELDEQDVFEGDAESEKLEQEIFIIKTEKESEEQAQLKNNEDFDKTSSDEENIQIEDKNMQIEDKKGFDAVQITESKDKLSNIRVLIGSDAAGNNIFWEFGNKNLANRHLLITGTSGHGKTYSIQAMLYELSTTGISSVIFDYTEGFMKTQLEKAFVDKMGDKIKEHIVYSTGVPINPFVQHEIEIGGIKVKEKPADVAARLADIFTHVYDFGDQQYAAIFTAALNGIQTYGDSMSMQYFQSELENIQGSNKTAKTVISKMEPFFHTISFENNSAFDWGNVLYGDDSALNIFQLTLINREMQVIITELMLWDAWYYTKKYGSKEKPFIVVLDEAQNLSHKAGSPSAVILTEGRKFGWSAWFATQSLKILKDEEVIRLLQVAFKMYFKPTDEEIVKIAKQLDPTGENNWTSEVKNLKKGVCIVVGDRVKLDGSFGGTQPTVVSVEAFEKRIK